MARVQGDVGLMALWCRDLPTVTVAHGLRPKRVTFIYPYYENRQFLLTQFAHWSSYPIELRLLVSAIIVDDGSPQPATLPSGNLPFPIRLFRIEVDRRWNWLAARNIGAHHADDGWLLLTDMDHVVPEETLRAVIFGQHEPRFAYAFSRREHTGAAAAPHSASFLMTRKMFWKVGGYDERCVGFYGSDGLYRRRLLRTAPLQVLTDALVRYEYVGDSSTQRYKRKQPEDAGLKRLVATFPPGSKPKTLSFPYHEVTT